MIRAISPELHQVLKATPQPEASGANARQDQSQASRLRVDDAVKVEISEDARQQVRAYEAHPGRELKLRAYEPPANSDPLFEEGATVEGRYGKGHFITESGEHGRYRRLKNGRIQFQVGDFRGILRPDHKALAYNKETGEMYSMDIYYRDGKFRMTNMKEVDPNDYLPPANTEVTNDTSNDFELRVLGDGALTRGFLGNAATNAGKDRSYTDHILSLLQYEESQK